jgi:3-hydroxy-9,10-secoandrosta-1,3,5(10)-triene-9,17-dione monooxygenase
VSEPLLEAARELREVLRAHEAETELQGGYGEPVHTLLRERGLYRLWLPERHGGPEGGLSTVVRVVAELARGCPSTAWSLCVLAWGSPCVRGTLGEDAHVQLLAEGELRAACASGGEAVALAAEDGGLRVSGTLTGVIGAHYATHVLGRARLESTEAEITFLAARRQIELLEPPRERRDGVASVRLEGAAIPAQLISDRDPGADVRLRAALAAARAAVFVGAAKRAAEVYEELVGGEERLRLDPDCQRLLGSAIGRGGSADLMLEQAAAGVAETSGSSRALRLEAVAGQARALAWAPVEELLATNGGPRPAELERIGRALLCGLPDPFGAGAAELARALARDQLGIV